MGILARFNDIMASNINALLDKCEDPEKMIDQALRNAEKDLATVTKETAMVMADAKSAKRKLDECEESVSKYTEAAQKAIKAGDDDGARVILSKKQSEEKKLASLRSTYTMAQGNADKMREMQQKLTRDIDELNSRRDAVKAKMATAKAQKSMNKLTSSVNTDRSIAAFERMEEKADKMLDAAEAEAELNAGTETADDVAAKYLNGGDTAVDDELEKMKKEMGLA